MTRAPSLQWYDYLGIIAGAAVYSGGSISAFVGGLVGWAIVYMVLRTVIFALYNRLVKPQGGDDEPSVPEQSA